jgi:hypothetical protein
VDFSTFEQPAPFQPEPGVWNQSPIGDQALGLMERPAIDLAGYALPQIGQIDPVARDMLYCGRGRFSYNKE